MSPLNEIGLMKLIMGGDYEEEEGKKMRMVMEIKIWMEIKGLT